MAHFEIANSISNALDHAPLLGAIPLLRKPDYWRAVILANRGVDIPREILKAEAWLVSSPERHYKHLGRFLTNWLNRAARDA